MPVGSPSRATGWPLCETGCLSRWTTGQIRQGSHVLIFYKWCPSAPPVDWCGQIATFTPVGKPDSMQKREILLLGSVQAGSIWKFACCPSANLLLAQLEQPIHLTWHTSPSKCASIQGLFFFYPAQGFEESAVFLQIITPSLFIIILAGLR